MKFETIDSQPMYRGRAFSVRQDRVRLPNGAESNLDIVEHIGAVTIMPVDSDGNVWFVRQYRHAIGIEILELPAGTLEPGEPPEVCAERETREEIGMGARKFRKIGAFYMAPGYSTEFMHVYLATDLSFSPLEADADEFLSVEKVPVAEAIQMAKRGEIPDAKSLAALFIAKSSLEKWL